MSLVSFIRALAYLLIITPVITTLSKLLGVGAASQWTVAKIVLVHWSSAGAGILLWFWAAWRDFQSKRSHE